jgi:hypothetical protein
MMAKAERDTTPYRFYQLRMNSDQSADVLGFRTYPDNSVLAGQTMKCFIDRFDTVEEAQAIYPEATSFYSKYTSAVNTFNHLPDDGPDDYPNSW